MGKETAHRLGAVQEGGVTDALNVEFLSAFLVCLHLPAAWASVVEK